MRFFDFHTHPYIEKPENITIYMPSEEVGYAHQRKALESIGITRAAGSVLVRRKDMDFGERMRLENKIAMEIYEEHPDFYVPGFRIDPNYTRESCELIEKVHKEGFRLIGELTPQSAGGWQYRDCGEIFALCEELGMVVSCHPTDDEDMRAVCREFPHLRFVFAHPGDAPAYRVNLERLKDFENAYLDISGTGLFRYTMLEHGVKSVGADRILFGTDYPVCNPAMYVGGVQFENLTTSELEKIAYKNAEALLGIS